MGGEPLHQRSGQENEPPRTPPSVPLRPPFPGASTGNGSAWVALPVELETMFSRSAQIFAVLALVELGVFALVATQVNVLLLILVVLASSALGLMFFFRQTAGLVQRSVEDIVNAGHGIEQQLGDRSLRLVGAALMVFPGLLTALFGALLMASPVRAAVRPVIGSRISRRIPTEFSAPMADLNHLFRRNVVDVDAVDVTSVRKDPGGSSVNPSAPPELH